MTATALATLSPLARIEAFGSGHLSLRTISPSVTPTTALSPLHSLVIDKNLPPKDGVDTKRLLLKILSCMRAIDVCFETILDYRKHVYLYDDQSLNALLDLSKASSDAPQEGNLSQLLEILGCLGLIYRFNVAPKFGLDESKMQLRLNGWGRIASDEYALEDTSTFRAAVDYVTEIINSKKGDYVELLRICNSDERPLDVVRIRSIVSDIPLTVVT